MNKQKTDWERKLMTLMVITIADALFAGRSRPITKDCSDVTVKHHKKISKFISQLLKTQREEIIKEIEGIVIGKLENFRASKLITSDILDKVLKVGETDWNIQIDENNRRLDELEKEIRERLKQI